MIDHRMDTFLLLCEVMNYRKTAEILNITQPAVTQQIQHLEREYDCQLFIYENRRLKKTEAAELLERHGRAIRLHDRAIRQQLHQKSLRHLRIGATKTIGDYYLQDYILPYLRSAENALTCVVDNTEHLLTMLENNDLDFAVVEGYFDQKRFDHLLLRREPFVGICAKTHPFAGREVGVDELLRETIIHREAGSGTREILERKLGGYNESLSQFRRQICLSSFKLILELVREGMGVSFVYNILADSDPGLGKFTIQGDPIVREFNIVYLKYADLTEKIGWFFPREVLP